jgi:hypothetical protein
MADDTEWPPHLDALIVAPANHRLLFEDDAVRMLEVTVEPGERENVHRHRWSSIMVVLARPNYRSFDANGNEIPPSEGLRHAEMPYLPEGADPSGGWSWRCAVSAVEAPNMSRTG